MTSFRRFEELDAWKCARELVRQVYEVSGKGRFATDYALRDQIRRAAISIMSNIAEGLERSGTREFSQFLSMAKGSAGEVAAQLYVAVDQGYLDERTFDSLNGLARRTGQLIGGLMNYLRKTPIKGAKYKFAAAKPDPERETRNPKLGHQ